MKKENLKLAALITVLCIIMGVVYVKIYAGKPDPQKCEGKTVIEIKGKEPDYHLHLDKSIKTKKDRCIKFLINMNLTTEADKVVFAGTKTKEYNDIFYVSTMGEDVKFLEKDATLDQNDLTVSIKALIKEKSQENKYDVEIKIPLVIKDGKIMEGK